MARRSRKKKNKNRPADASPPVSQSDSPQPSRDPSRGQIRLVSGVFFLALLTIVVLFFVSSDGQDEPSAEKTEEEKSASTFVTPAGLSEDRLTSTLNTSASSNIQSQSDRFLDPSEDGWDSEVVAEQAKVQLKHLAGRVAGKSLDEATLAEISTDVICRELRPHGLTRMFSDEGDSDRIVVWRSPAPPSPQEIRGHEGLERELGNLARSFENAQDIHFHVKVIRIETTEATASTTAYFEADGKTEAGSLQVRSTWYCTWERLPEGDLLLKSIRAEDYEEVMIKGPWLVDCTDAIFEGNESFDRQLAFGLNHWLLRLGKVHGIHVYARNGLCLGDVNGDGLDDVYVCQPGGLPNRLFLQQPDGRVQDVSGEAGVDWYDQTSGALLVDLDNDGDQDLVAATLSGLLVMENDGTGKFRLKSTLATNDIDTQSISAADYDNDGDIDLFVCIEFARQLTLQRPSDVSFVYHNANDGAANALYRNDIQGSNWKFTNVTKEVGLDENNQRHSLACAWEDFDNDGDQDLYVANDYGHNCLYENTDGKFRDIASQANVLDTASGMSVSWGDYDHDGKMDLYVANMFSSAGNRVTQQERFKSGNEQLQDVYLRFAKGNTLLRNLGEDGFEDVGSAAGVEMGRWAWSSVFSDFNNDSWDDLLVANGYISTEDSGDL